MKFVCGVGELGLPGMFSAARRRIVLHAAVYGPFAESQPHLEGLEKTLSRSSFCGMDIITLQPGSGEAWTGPFMHALRFGITSQSVAEELDRSTAFLQEMSRRYPEKVNIYYARTLPCLPVVIVDDVICFGQYAHSCVQAPHGIWGSMEADVEKLFQWAESGRVPEQASARETAAFRLVCECAQAMKCGHAAEGAPDGCARS
ncbi:hypothetical protein [Maridesulfovibrio sp.]|uniref:hypothetical protein n=1 Tax=Maridesulfovibrio sp. TaxID=2795000 RepID=UPI002A18BF5B|nr:hypothetical protein [Maridesulfovibrio sp.]